MRALLLREAFAMAPILVAWAVLLVLLLTVTVRAARAVSLRRIAGLLRDESGAAYSLMYLLTLPLYMLFIAFFLEFSFIMICKTGTIYAAFAAARVGSVWANDNPPSAVDQRIAFTARRAFTPFASGLAEFRGKPVTPQSNTETQRYAKTYESYNRGAGNDRVFRRYVEAKHRYASQAVRTEIQRAAGGSPWDQDLSVTVSYDYPFGTLGVGRAIGRRGADGFFIYPLSTTVTLKAELPRNNETSLGIAYLRLP